MPAGREKPLIGGQAVIEGVMMRSRHALAVAVRLPGGAVAIRKERLRPISDRVALLRRPFLRGVPALVSSLVLGIRALNYSASQAMEEEGEGEGGSWLLALSTALALIGGAALFFCLPLVLSQALSVLVPALGRGVAFNAVDGLLRLAVFLLYLLVISRWREIRRVFEYHGAEHMAVSAYEHGGDLSVAGARRFGTAHRRCGTSFLLAVMVLSVLLFSLIPGEWSLGAKLLARLLLLPALAGLSYEVIRFGGRGGGGVWTRAAGAPGLWLQRLTTREPDDGQIEVALEALKAALPVEEVNAGA